MRKVINFAVNKVFVEKKSPFEIYFPFKGYFYEKYYASDRFAMSEEEVKMHKNLIVYFTRKKQYSERCLGHFTTYRMSSNDSLVKSLSEMTQLKNNIHIFYGDHDWMDTEATYD